MFAGEPIRAADVRAAAKRGSDLRTAATAADADADVRTRFYCSAHNAQEGTLGEKCPEMLRYTE